MSSGAVRRFFFRRVVEPLKAQLTQGATPGQLALAVALGLVIGAVPFLGITALICAAVAWALKLNQPAIQVANYLAYPLQIVLFIPFFHAGAELFGEPRVALGLDQLRAEVAADLAGTVGRYAAANLRAVTAWGLVAPFAVGLLYLVVRPLLARARRASRAARPVVGPGHLLRTCLAASMALARGRAPGRVAAGKRGGRVRSGGDAPAPQRSTQASASPFFRRPRTVHTDV